MRVSTSAAIVTIVAIDEILNRERLHWSLLFNSLGRFESWGGRKGPTNSTIHLVEWRCYFSLCSPVNIGRDIEERVIIFMFIFNKWQVFHERHFTDVHICKMIYFHLWSWILERVMGLDQLIDSCKILESCGYLAFWSVTLAIGRYELNEGWFNL